MKMILFSLCFLAASTFVYLNIKIQELWVKKVMLFYALLFTVASFATASLYIIENQQMIAYATSTIIGKQQFTSEEAPQHSNLNHTEVKLKEAVKLDVPLIEQMPELPRGCEVTALGMLLSFHNIKVDKMELAEKVEKNKSKYKIKNGQVNFGNPYNGFVGNMYTFDKPGLGVYHGPISELATQYAKDKNVLDFTGSKFSKVIEQLNLGRPVWVIINSHYKKLPPSQFETWQTEDGPIDITYREHSVVITGYDEHFIYFNDPLNHLEKADKKNFIAAWEQMGKQAISIY